MHGFCVADDSSVKGEMMNVRLYIPSSCIGAAFLLAACGGANSGAAPQSAIPQAGGYSSQSGATQSNGAQAFAATGSFAAPPLPDVPLALGVRPALTSPMLNDSGSYPGGAIIAGSNSGAGGTGVEGIAGTAGGYGLVGLNDATSGTGANIGVYGRSTAPDGDGVYGYSSRHLAVVGVSPQGYGVDGQTSFPSNNGTYVLQKSGVLGEDLSTDGGAYDAGVAGTSTSGYGIYGRSNAGVAVAGQAMTTGAGVEGYVLAGASGGVAVAADNFGAGTGQNGSGDGISAMSRNASAIVAEGLSTSPSTPVELLQSNGVQPLLIGKNAVTNAAVMSLDKNGTMILAGNLVVDGSITAPTYYACGTCAGPLARRGAPIEDTGEGQLSGGRAYVRLDPGYAAQLDPAQHYLVFITPEGDTKGLYVADRSPSGFAVRESQNGGSSVAFAYRIVGPSRSGRVNGSQPLQTAASPLVPGSRP